MDMHRVNHNASGVTLKHRDITDKILHAFFKVVYPELGYGFLEKVYENALALSLRQMGLKVEQQAKILVHFSNELPRRKRTGYRSAKTA